jgi:heme exporter protein D|tara:strand:+ start:47 stop:274 length:228 start_codon:yes stop_codon:yes gene_type:complete
MIKEILLMDGHGIYVWSAFMFTLFNLIFLYVLTKVQYLKEKKKFISKFGTLNSERAAFAKAQSINRSILSNTSKI